MTSSSSQIAHRRVCMFCGKRASVIGDADWDELDIDAAFAAQGRSFSDVDDGDPIGVGCVKCARKQWAKAGAS